MSRTYNVREPNLKYDLTVPDDVPEVYVDGMTQLLLGFPSCKILFHSLSGSTDFKPGPHDLGPVENRNAKLQLVIPLPALLDLVKNVLDASTRNKDSIANASFQITSGVQANIDYLASKFKPESAE